MLEEGDQFSAITATSGFALESGDKREALSGIDGEELTDFQDLSKDDEPRV